VKIWPEDADVPSGDTLDMVGVAPAVSVPRGAVAERPGELVIDRLGCGAVVVVEDSDC
jgi:hypothetical protein